MPKKWTLAEIDAQIEQLQHRADLLRARHKKPVIDAIINAMNHYHITHDELLASAPEGAAGRKRKARANGKSGAGRGRRVRPKYRNPKTGETWSGRGRPARWLAELERQGKSRDRFLIR
jgi:DNA-binding protein H-NS